jgi:imidazolonepropionase-like amidohydrolase
VDESPINVEPYFKQTGAVPIVENPATTATTTNNDAQQQQSVSHVMAELLASGYVLTESVVTKGAEFDQKHGVSTRVNGYLTKVGIHLSPKRVANDTTRSTPQEPIKSSRMQGLINSRASLKMQGFASRVADKVSVVHEEAKKIAVSKLNKRVRII